MRWFFGLLLAMLAVSAHAQDARRIVEPLNASIIDNSRIVAVEIKAAPTAEKMVAKFDSAAAKQAKRPGASSDDYAALPTAAMFPLVMRDIATEFNLSGAHEIRLVVTLDVLKVPSAALAILWVTNEQIAGMVEVLDAASGAPMGMFHIDVVNTYGDGFGLDVAARGAAREFMAREFARETVRVLAGRKSRIKGESDPGVAQ